MEPAEHLIKDHLRTAAAPGCAVDARGDPLRLRRLRRSGESGHSERAHRGPPCAGIGAAARPTYGSAGSPRSLVSSVANASVTARIWALAPSIWVVAPLSAARMLRPS